MDEKIKVLLVDDHAVVRAGLRTLLSNEPDISIVGEAKDGIEAIAKAGEVKPDVILMDIFMPRCSGLEAVLKIKQDPQSPRVLILTVSEREQDLFQALRLGADGYLLKSATINEVAEAIRRTFAGEGQLSPGMASRLMAEFRRKASRPELSVRELEVLELLAEGLPDAEIASKLFISVSTVRTYLHRLLEKLHLKNRVEAAAYAVRYNTGNGNPKNGPTNIAP